MYCLCSEGAHVAKQLLQSADNDEANRQDIDGRSPLSYAAWNGATDLCTLLVECGAAVNITDAKGRTPLHNAARWGHKDIVKLLIAAGARKDVSDFAFVSPGDFAAILNDHELRLLLT